MSTETLGAVLTDEQRVIFDKVTSGLDGLEAALPEECTEETQEAIGVVITRAKKAEKFVAATFKEIVEPSNVLIKAQRALWKPLGERAVAIALKAQGLVETLLEKERQRRVDEEAEARRLVAEKQKIQADAEAKALAADSEEDAAEAQKQAEIAWNETRKAVSDLDKAPAQTSVKVGEATVYESSNLDFEVLDVGKFATAHPELVEIRRGPTLAALRKDTSGLTELPETMAGWPGLRLKLKTKTAAR